MFFFKWIKLIQQHLNKIILLKSKKIWENLKKILLQKFKNNLKIHCENLKKF